MQSVLDFFLYRGTTSAVFKQSGNTPEVKDALMQWVSGVVSNSIFENRMLQGMASGPWEDFFAKALTALSNSSFVHGCRNIESGGSPLRKAIGSVSVGGTVAACILPTSA